MNQSDFRALLSSSGGGGGGSTNSASGGSRGGSFGGKRQLTEADLAEVRRLSKKKPKKKGGRKPTGGDGDKEGDAAAASAYRDRAAERRQGGASDMVDAAEFAHLDAAQSKFLGGDLAHTHLVKGLDFALLAQLKREREALLLATAAAQQQQQKQQASGGLNSKQQQQQLAFRTRLGRLVYFHAVQSSAAARATAQPTENFLPGRMYYTFNLSASAPESVPVVVQRSKEDCPEPEEVVSGMVSELVISRVGEALRHKRHSGKKLRKKKTELGEDGGSGGGGGRAGDKRGAAATDPASDDDGDDGMAAESKHFDGAGAGAVAAVNSAPHDDSEDEDIFPDVGEYVPIHARAAEDEEEEKKSSSEPHADSRTGAGYFSNLSASLSAAERAEKKREEEAEQAWKQTIRKVVATQSAAEREKKERERKAREAQAGAQVDEYSECYPEYQAAASAFDSEDDEEKPRRSKDEEKEVSAEDAAAEKSRRRKQKQGNKLQNDLEKISKVRVWRLGVGLVSLCRAVVERC